MSDIIREIEKGEAAKHKKAFPKFGIGDTVKVFVKVVEGNKTRTQAFEGTVIAENGSGISRTFTVRKISFDIGVERIFPYNSPKISKIEVKREGYVRRAKLYYLRDRVGKATKVKAKKIVKTTAKKRTRKTKKTESANE
ncbi:MAG TPA: 50S ribosomal protein L19 [Firmicutes bacterium]|nr:50S ribosomal protein L19 [Bacillota bacterium]